MNLKIRCQNCGREFTAAYKPAKGAHCPICRKNPAVKKYQIVKPKISKRSYVRKAQKVKIK